MKSHCSLNLTSYSRLKFKCIIYVIKILGSVLRVLVDVRSD